uniref:Uncharacterized protein n=1 Tax=Lepeophtheirus salmonis TaxID=72036 RepID=A0A0K2VB87_LEPSM
MGLKHLLTSDACCIISGEKMNDYCKEEHRLNGRG